MFVLIMGMVHAISQAKMLEKDAGCCKWSSPEEWESSSNTPIAWLVLTHDNITLERSIRLLHRIWRSHHTYVVHVDKSVSHSDFMLFVSEIREEFPLRENIFVISKLRGGHRHELIEIELELLRMALNPFLSSSVNDKVYSRVSNNSGSSYRIPKWEYAAILSGDSYPLQDIDVIVRRISSKYPPSNRLGYPCVYPQKTKKRILKTEHGDEIIKLVQSAYRNCSKNGKSDQFKDLRNCGINKHSKRFKKKYEVPILWGEQWVVLTRDFAEYSITSEFAHEFFQVMKYVLYAGDELYFQNLMYGSCRSDFVDVSFNKTQLDKNGFMYTPWERGSNGAFLELRPDDAAVVVGSGLMFGRKVRRLDTEQAIERMIKDDRNHEDDFVYYCKDC